MEFYFLLMIFYGRGRMLFMRDGVIFSEDFAGVAAGRCGWPVGARDDLRAFAASYLMTGHRSNRTEWQAALMHG